MLPKKSNGRPPEILPSLRSVLFPPCHSEQGRNPREARIGRCEASFGISAEKVRLGPCPSLRMTRAGGVRQIWSISATARRKYYPPSQSPKASRVTALPRGEPFITASPFGRGGGVADGEGKRRPRGVIFDLSRITDRQFSKVSPPRAMCAWLQELTFLPCYSNGF